MEHLNSLRRCGSYILNSHALLLSCCHVYRQVVTTYHVWFGSSSRSPNLTSSHPIKRAESFSRKEVTTICESQIQQSNMEASNYLCKAVSDTTIWVVRKAGTAPAHCVKCSSQATCEKCVPNSPIPHFKRKRIISLTPIEDSDLLQVVCSCPFHSTYGIPCRHFVALLPVRPHHVHIRWHSRCAALFGREGHEILQAEFQKKQFDARLKVTQAEKEEMLQNAMRFSSENESLELFQAPLSQFLQRNPSGVLQHNERVVTRPELGIVSPS